MGAKLSFSLARVLRDIHSNSIHAGSLGTLEVGLGTRTCFLLPLRLCMCILPILGFLWPDCCLH